MFRSSLPNLTTQLPGPNSLEHLAKAKDNLGYKAPIPIVIQRAAGNVIEDIDGNLILDFRCGQYSLTGHGDYDHADLETKSLLSPPRTQTLFGKLNRDLIVGEVLGWLLSISAPEYRMIYSSSYEHAIETATALCQHVTGDLVIRPTPAKAEHILKRIEQGSPTPPAIMVQPVSFDEPGFLIARDEMQIIFEHVRNNHVLFILDEGDHGIGVRGSSKWSWGDSGPDIVIIRNENLWINLIRESTFGDISVGVTDVDTFATVALQHTVERVLNMPDDYPDRLGASLAKNIRGSSSVIEQVIRTSNIGALVVLTPIARNVSDEFGVDSTDACTSLAHLLLSKGVLVQVYTHRIVLCPTFFTTPEQMDYVVKSVRDSVEEYWF